MWILDYSKWIKIKEFELEIKQWVHTCVNFNRLDGTIKVSVDGSEVETVRNSTTTTTTTTSTSSTTTTTSTSNSTSSTSTTSKSTTTTINTTTFAVETFNITVGKVLNGFKYFNKPFGGLVTNINIFNYSSEHDLKNMSANPCLYAAHGDLLSWDDIAWESDGETVEQISIDEEEICIGEKFYNVPLPTLFNWNSAQHACSILGDGKISQIQNIREMEKLVELSAPCIFRWTPYSDENEEGSFINIYDGEPMPNLPWKKGNPSLGTAGNNVLLKHEINVASGLTDAASYRSACAVCNISKVC